ncbi:ABC-type cobalamin/Fe3+-siderophores transport system, ATPase component [Butyrivibrio proteoclasticus]|uniref:ABC-type cobalamin/Fe3+-siderophores transport system, ATPase component n=1 Tax=Butyrivibrio proteoclasticus TaxID=43305 RepID=A0A1I5SQR2_9FIRM|nr:ABC transporter ATP-binding protein [Butyrivibrio proteoclasticus]SFP73073.1 ABC-type cobalamin/Fe3+-siderophores transport system, ATPase component [Butyrivibrio proteoclasticus]
MNKVLRVYKLDVGYRKNVVSGITMEVMPGEIVALIGPNGAGKSTILNTITRQLEKLSGNIYIKEKEDKLVNGEELSTVMSMVTTKRITPQLMSAREVVATGRYPYTGRLGILSPKDWEKVDQSIALVDAKEFAENDFGKLSDGQRQRIMLARAICQEPEIMILDEPTSFLDIQFKVDILSIIKRMAKRENIAVVLSMHDLEFVEALADKVVAINDGRVVAVGAPEEIVTGETIEEIYHMEKGCGKTLIDGLRGYSDALFQLINR